MNVLEIRGFGLDALAPAERPEPTPGPGQVLLKLRAASLNYRDLMIVRGQYNPKLRFPRIPLSDGVGEVVALGEGAEGVAIGNRVAGLFMPGWREGALTEAKSRTALGDGVDGLLAEYAVLPADGVVAVPPHLSDEEAACLPCAAVTAWNALVVGGGIQAGDVVLVQGTGGVSLFALQFARMHGARVIATSSSDEKLARAIALGASDGVNYRANPDWGRHVRQLAGGQGVDHVVEVGGAGTLAQSLMAVKVGGHIALIGVLAGMGQFDPLPVLMKSVRLQGVYGGSGAMFAAMNRAIALAGMRPVVDRVFPFDEAREALQHMAGGSHFGKVALRF